MDIFLAVGMVGVLVAIWSLVLVRRSFKRGQKTKTSEPSPNLTKPSLTRATLNDIKQFDPKTSKLIAKVITMIGMGVVVMILVFKGVRIQQPSPTTAPLDPCSGVSVILKVEQAVRERLQRRTEAEFQFPGLNLWSKTPRGDSTCIVESYVDSDSEYPPGSHPNPVRMHFRAEVERGPQDRAKVTKLEFF